MKSTVVFILLILKYSVAFSQDEIEMQNLLEKEKLSGVVWSVVQNDRIEINAAGFKNLSTKEKMKPTDKVHVGSITKTILALGVLKLASENKLSLDDPVRKYMNELPIENPWEKTSPIRVRHLLDHTSGLSDLRLWHFFSSSSNSNTALSEFYSIKPEVLKVHVKPGELFSYSNMGYTLLGMLIEKITSQRYETYLDDNLLKPIGMLNSTFQFKSQEGNFRDRELAMGHFEDGNLAPAIPIYLRPAGQFTTTAKDMGKLIQFIVNKGNIENKQLIDLSYIEKLGRPQYTTAYKHGLNSGYAFGLVHRDRFGVIGLAHSGNIVGYKAMLYIFPEEKKGFFISHNMDSETADYDVFNGVLIKTLQIPKRNKTKSSGASIKKFRDWEGYYVPVITKIEPLKLLDIIGSFNKVELNGENMVITPFQKKSIKLMHLNNGLFQAEDRVNPSHLLYENENDKYLTTGTFTLQKMNGWIILILSIGFILGIIGSIIILVMGIGQSFKYRFQIIKQPIFSIYFSILLLLGSIILISSKNILFIGDMNLGSILLYISTVLFPFGVVLSLFVYLKSNKYYLRKPGFWALIFLFQWCILLITYRLIPFTTWN